ncbi:hypothetical protein M0R72_21500 [Candidatus Pacearchaeota archaeon]|jgi:hypothetical protein|nr:hypothetical protein [Candidatus Pacearchaeota archaeon]
MAGFTKLVPEIVMSSIWNESPEVRCVWIAMLATKDENGYVRGNAASLARTANVSIEAVRIAIDVFQRPDEESNTPDNEGRRIQAVPGGWFVLNHALYRGKDYREYEAERKRQYREKHQMSGTSPGQVPDCSASGSVSTSVEGESRGEASKPPVEPEKPKSKPCVIPDCLSTVAGFAEAFAAWVEFRLAKRAKATDRVKATILKRLAERPEQATAALDTCMAAGWTDVRWDWIDNRNNGVGTIGHRKHETKPSTFCDDSRPQPEGLPF